MAYAIELTDGRIRLPPELSKLEGHEVALVRYNGSWEMMTG